MELLVPVGPSTDAVARKHAWRRWFEGWLHEPLAKRSTGTNVLPSEYFSAVADFIVSTLRLEPARDRVLDVGCDSAMVSQHVAPHCQRFIGVDFIAGLLRDSRRHGGPGASLTMAAADGRHLPFPARSFDKVYCSAVIHTLPTYDDAHALIDELIRVCRPGGEVLIASVPDIHKRGASQRLIWRRSGWRGRCAQLGSWVAPATLRHWFKYVAGRPAIDPMRYLEFDLVALAHRFSARGMRAAVVDFPSGFWSVDFRTSRSSLHIVVPPASRGAS